MSTKTLGKAKTAGSVPQEVKRISPLQKALRRDKYLLLMILPVIIWYLIFCYLPMAGLWMSFTDFVPGKGLAGLFTGKFVGLKWFRKFFESPYAFRLVRNTFLMAFYSLIFGFPIPIIFAICITQIKRKSLRQAGQVLTYLPYFISTVVVCGMINNFLSPSTGIINKIIQLFGGCRLTLHEDGKTVTKFACVDGPDFDGYAVDFDEAISRASMYRDFERKKYEETCNLFGKEAH